MELERISEGLEGASQCLRSVSCDLREVPAGLRSFRSFSVIFCNVTETFLMALLDLMRVKGNPRGFCGVRGEPWRHFRKPRMIFGGFYGCHRCVAGDFRESLLRHMGSKNSLWRFQRHFSKVQRICSEFPRRSWVFWRVSGALHEGRGGLRGILVIFPKVSEDFKRVSVALLGASGRSGVSESIRYFVIFFFLV